ncbi:MAG: 23S rRNA (adenine(2503)-C(2))-methyltransferase RlmN [Deltaproteobacteria bacterium]|nr:23S rRNA (adenine(2503)-C(2))-methyltransferase RlmN [Deltaproteobacteria bacterium]
MKPNIKDLSREELIDWLDQHKEPSYRSDQIRRWLLQRGVFSFSEMTNLSTALRDTMRREFSISRLPVLLKSRSRDGTEKFLFGLADGYSIETVLIPEGGRLTLCLSTQAGCGLGCTFCATAQMGLRRNLKSSEILDQIIEVQAVMGAGKRLTNLVFMGMGEPLANYEQTLKSLKDMTDARGGLGFSPRRITVSTVGLVPQIRRLMEDTKVNLAVSLHATTDTVRSRLMPINRKYSLAELIECCRALPLQRRKRITFEYILLQGINHEPADASRLSSLLKGIRCKINLIPFNPYHDSPYQPPTPAEVDGFKDLLMRRGFQVNVRQSRGQDVHAACGQLWSDFRSERVDPKSKETSRPASKAALS